MNHSITNWRLKKPRGMKQTEQQRVGCIEELLRQESAKNFAAEYATAEQLFNLVRAHLIDRLTPVFNKELQESPQENVEQKKELAKRVNALLRRLSLAIKCPVTGEPAFLTGINNGYNDKGMFRVHAWEPGNYRNTRSYAKLPDFELIPSHERVALGQSPRQR